METKVAGEGQKWNTSELMFCWILGRTTTTPRGHEIGKGLTQ